MPQEQSAAATGATVDVGKLVDQAPLGGLQLRVLALAMLAIILDGFDIQVAAFSAPAILADWGIERSALAPVFAFTLLGMAVGTVLGGWLGDRLGRRRLLVGSAVFFGLLTVASALARDVTELTILRGITGLGLGAAIPNATAALAEWAPARLRSLSVTAVIVGVPIGGMVGSALAGVLIPAEGWRAVFVAGGLLALVVAVLVAVLMPESPRYLARRSLKPVTLAEILARIDPRAGVRATDRFVLVEEARPGSRDAAREIFQPGYLRSTLGLWLAFFASMLATYLFTNWIPVVLSGAGLPQATAIQGSFYYNLFGIFGAIVVGAAIPRLGTRATLMAMALLAAGAALALGAVPIDTSSPEATAASGRAMLAGIAVSGLLVNGLQCGCYALAAHVYLTSCRSTGIGAAVSIGRLGAVLSAVGGAVVFELGLGTKGFFVSVAVCLVAAALANLVVTRHVPRPGSRAV